MNIDTDTQWASWKGVREYYETNKEYLRAQIGNPDGEDIPNKKYYDPRVWWRELEKSFVERVKISFSDLNALNRF
jgi:fructose-bisphosphate aldolase class II